MENRENAGEGICIVSFDGGGPGSLSQLRILDELMLRLAFKPGVKVDELRPADYFDLMGGVGFGGLVALLLGRLRMTTSQAMDELSTIGAEIFPEEDTMITREVNMARLRGAVGSMLVRHGHPVDIKLHDSAENQCKVVLFAAPTVAMDHCHTFRTYPAPRKSLECTLVDAACASMAIPEYFPSVAIGPRRRKQSFAGIPHGFDNPIREVLKESQLVFGETSPVSLVLSLGSGQKARPSDLDQHVTRSSSIHCDGVARGLQYQFQGVAEYLRLNVDNGMENIELDDWSELGSIETFTNVYLEMNLVTKYIDKACQWLRNRNGSVTLGQLTGTNADCVVKFHSESLENYLKMEFNQMHNVIQQLGIKWITLVDPIGNDIPIPISLCLNYKMLSEVISVYFRHQKVPGSDFVKRRDYRLVHGDRKTIVDPIEWTRVEKVGLKVEMSMILRRRNQNITRCPSCSTSFGGHATDGWAQCLSCSTQFQIETQVQVEPQVRSEDMIQSDEEPLTELVTPAVEAGHTDASGVTPDSPTRREFESSQPRMREHTNSGEIVQLQFRLISVINTTAVLSSPPPPTAPPSPAPQPNNFWNGDVVPPSGPDSERSPKPQGKLLVHDKVVHPPETQMRILRLSKREQAIVLTDGGNTVESQLCVLEIIEQYPPDHNNERVWTEARILLPSGKETTQYHCKATGCGYRDVKFQKARQHFVSCHVAKVCWGCPIEGCTHVGKYKRLDDLKSRHMVPSHGIKYTRDKSGIHRNNASTAGQAAFAPTDITSPPEGQFPTIIATPSQFQDQGLASPHTSSQAERGLREARQAGLKNSAGPSQYSRPLQFSRTSPKAVSTKSQQLVASSDSAPKVEYHLWTPPLRPLSPDDELAWSQRIGDSNSTTSTSSDDDDESPAETSLPLVPKQAVTSIAALEKDLESDLFAQSHLSNIFVPMAAAQLQATRAGSNHPSNASAGAMQLLAYRSPSVRYDKGLHGAFSPATTVHLALPHAAARRTPLQVSLNRAGRAVVVSETTSGHGSDILAGTEASVSNMFYQDPTSLGAATLANMHPNALSPQSHSQQSSPWSNHATGYISASLVQNPYSPEARLDKCSTIT